jgi:hypothetical protein
MPVVPYYRGRPAHVWITALTGHRPVQETPANDPAAASPDGQTPPASPRPTTPPAQLSKHPEAGARSLATASAGPWTTWASHWFTPHG